MSKRSLVIASALCVCAAVAGGALVVRRHNASEIRGQTAAPNEPSSSRAERTADPVGYVTLRSDVNDATNLNDLVVAYGAWARRPEAVAARKAIAHALLGHKDARAGVAALLTAVDSDQTPRTADPLWDSLAGQLAGIWNARTFDHGRDLIQLEERGKPRALLLESLARLDPEKLTAQQKPLLASDFIDLYPSLAADQKPLVDKALAALSSRDVVDILAGRGLSPGSTELELGRRRQHSLDEVARHPVKEAEPEP